MIDHNNHHSRYCELMSLASRSAPARRRDFGYMAAIYILSADPELFALSRDKIGPDGINFSRIRASVRRLELSDSQRTARRGLQQPVQRRFFFRHSSRPVPVRLFHPGHHHPGAVYLERRLHHYPQRDRCDLP